MPPFLSVYQYFFHVLRFFVLAMIPFVERRAVSSGTGCSKINVLNQILIGKRMFIFMLYSLYS